MDGSHEVWSLRSWAHVLGGPMNKQEISNIINKDSTCILVLLPCDFTF